MGTSLQAKLVLTFVFFCGLSLCKAHETGRKDSLNRRLNQFEKGELQLSVNQQIDLFNALANEFKFRKPDSILYYVQKALNLNNPVHYQRGYILSTIRYGDYFGDIGEVTQASQKYQKALELAEDFNDPELEISLLQGLALHSFFNQRNEDWYEYLQRSIELAKENKFLERWAVLRHIEGYLLYNYQLYAEANQSQQFADSLFLKIGMREMTTMTKINLAQNALAWGKLEKFKKYTDSSLSLLAEKPDNLWEIRLSHILSQYHLGKKEYPRALYWNNRSFGLLNNVTLPRERLENFSLRSAIYLGLMENDSATHYALKSRSLSGEINDSIRLSQAYLILSEVFNANQQQDSSLAYILKHAEIQNLVNASKKKKRLNLIRERYEFENLQLDQRKTLNTKSKTQNIALILILLLLGILLIINYQLQKNKRDQIEIQAKLKQLGSAKDRIFSMVSYDLVTPIDTLKNMLSLYENKNISNSEILAMIPDLKSKVEKSSFTLNNLLYWTQLQSTTFTVNPKIINLKSRSNLIYQLFEEQIRSKKIKINCAIPFDCAIRIDVNHLDIVLKNVISNAIKFTPNGGELQLNAFIENKEVHLEIFNSGKSISPYLIRVLQKDDLFVSTTGTSEEKGTGFGLKITKELLKRNHGDLDIIPKPEEGTLVRLTIPLACGIKEEG